MKLNSGIKLSILFFTLSLVINTVFSQKVRTISNFRYFEYKDGLPENDVKDFLTDDENGYWFRTSGSITFFNGYEFTNYKKGNKTFNLVNEQLFSFNLFQNYIYVFGNSGIDVINWKTKESFCIYAHRNSLKIRNGFITSKGRILIVASDGTVFQLQENQLKKVGSITYYTQCTIKETTNGDILISNDNKEIALFDSNLSFIKKIFREIFDLIPGGIYMHSRYETVIATNQFNYRYDSQIRDLIKIDELPPLNRLFCESLRYLYSVSNYNKIIQTQIVSPLITNINIALNKNYFINKISLDRNTTVVLCTNQGVVLFNELNNNFYELPIPIKSGVYGDNTRRAIIETSDHKILQLTYWWIAIFDPLTSGNKLITLSNNNYYAALRDDDIVWIGTDGQGLTSINLKDARLSPQKQFVGEGVDSIMHITALNKLNDKYLLIGTSISNITLKTFDIQKSNFKDVVINGWPGGVLKDKVSQIIDAKSGGKWICSNKGLIHLSEDLELKRWIGRNELGTDFINYVYEDEADNIWIATDHGLFLYNLSHQKIIKRFTDDNGLAGNKCISIIPDNYKTLWVPTYTGLSRVDLKSEGINNFYIHDGLADNEYNYSSFLRASSGDIYLGGLNNYVYIKPFPFDAIKKTSFTLSIDYILFNKKGVESLVKYEAKQPLNMHFKDDRLHFKFSLKNQLFSEFVSYQYRVKGLNDKWISLNRNNNIVIDYLPPGDYSLQIQSMDIHDKLKIQEIEIPLSVYNYFYESVIFYFLLITLIIGLISSVFIVRFNALKKIGRLKTDLSNDIHDEIGTIFTKAIMKLDLLNQKAGNLYPEIGVVERSLRDGIQRFRNVLWSLNTDHGKSDDFAARVNTTISEVFSDTRFDFRVTNKSMNVYFNRSIKVRRNLLLIIRELAHNTLKHSNGDMFEVVIIKESNKWVMEILDNGT
ncbi:MAG: triple tyrosine motif-containing protein, partial [Chitinophagaceae bacterium]